MSDSIDPQAGAPPVTNPDVLSAQGKQSARMTGGGPLQWEPPTIEEMARLFPTYEILGLLGCGGMGAVYKARQVALDRLVAIKLLPLEVSVDRSFAERFVCEARAMAKLTHPNIVAVHDFGTTSEGHLFFVMEFVAGANLHAIIHEVGLNPDQALSLAGQICTALAYAHAKGVVHRDIKPANVMVDAESHVKVADFGLARLIDANPEPHGMTMTGMVMGTPDYMAPEQKHGMNVDHRADIYSLGVMLYEMVCREVPEGAFDLPSRRTGCDVRLDAIVVKAMQKSPERRYQTTQEMKVDVETARTPLPRAPIPQPRAVVPVVRPPVRGPRAAAVTPIPRRPAARITVMPTAEKSRTPLYAGIATTIVGAIIFVGMAMQEPKPKHAGKLSTPGEDVPNERPLANSPKTKPTPAPIAETPKDHAVVNSPATKPAPVPAEEKPVPPNPQSATEKWIAEQEPKWQAAFVVEVSAPFEKSVADLKKQYLGALEVQLATATRSGQLAAAAAFRDEIQLLAGGDVVGEDDALTPAALKAMRSGYRKNFAPLETARAAGAKAIHARYDAIMARNEALLTQTGRLDEASELRTKREELTASWIKPPTVPDASKPPLALNTPPVKVAPVPVPEPVKLQPVVNSPNMKFGLRRIAEATKERPFENSLGMRFVPVPIAGVPVGGPQVLFSIWETRVQDYEMFAKENTVEWPKPGFPQGPTHPAVNMTWANAKAFCVWLTEHERRGGRLGAADLYRLPTDHEWSCAVGIGDQEDPAKTPAQKHMKIMDVYPWEKPWPPPHRAGNYSGVETKGHTVDTNQSILGKYRDEVSYTAPAGKFSSNRLGIYDLGGNAWEWCENLFSPPNGPYVLRGACFANHARDHLMSSFRFNPQPLARSLFGFRVVLSVGEPVR